MSVKDFKVCSTPIEPNLTLIEASAGTGKTYSLVRIIAREIVELDIPIEQILTVTFTRAATAEIKERLHALLCEISTHLKQEDLEKETCNDLVWHWRHNQPEVYATAPTRVAIALANFDRAAVFTIDGFFQRLLKESAFEANALFSTELVTDESSFTENALRDYWRQHVYSLTPTQLRMFQSFVKFDDAKKFLTNALRYPNATFDAAYHTSPNAISQAYLDAWKHCAPLLLQHAEELQQFVIDLPGGLKKSGHPYSSGGPQKLATTIEQIHQAPDEVPSSVQLFTRLTSSYFSNPSAYKKGGKPDDIKNHPLAPLFQAFDALVSAQPQGLQSAYYGEILRFCRQRIQELKQDQNVQGYGDVTATLARMLRENTPASQAVQRNTRNRYQACLIDEFQDTSPDQCQVFLSLFHDPERYFHIVGDPKQSIYRFRGADVFSYIKVTERNPRTYQLRTNYRSSPVMVQAVNSFFSLSTDPFLTNGKIHFTPSLWKDDEKALEPKEAALHIHHIPEELSGNKDNIKKTTTKHICTEIHRLLGQPWSSYTSKKDGSIQPSDIAILVRDGYEGNSIYSELCRQNIPATLNTRSSLMESEEAQQMLIILRAILEPRRPKLLRTALLSPPLGSGRLFDQENEEAFNHLCHQAAELHSLWDIHGLMPMMLECIRQFDIRATLLKLPQGQRRITNFLHLIELLDEKASQQKLNPAGAVHWFEMALQNQTDDILDNETLELRISTDDDAVQLLTQHACKGLEFPIVFALCPCASEQSKKKISLAYHDADNFDLHFAPAEDNMQSAETLQTRSQEDHADAARLAYVALTRSVSLCHFYLPPPKTTKTKGCEPDKHSIYRMLDMESPEALSSQCNLPGTCIESSIIDTSVLNNFKRYSAPSHTKPATLTSRNADKINITRQERTTSFTGITRNAPETIHDIDENTGTPYTDETPTNQNRFWDQLQGGASLGLVFHEVLEVTNFQAPSNLTNTIATKLDQYRPWRIQPDDGSALSQEIADTVEQWLDHPFDDSDAPFTLNQLADKQRINECEFLITGSQFSLQSLAKVLDISPPANMPSNYTEQLCKIEQSQLDGYLTGFIDLVFEHQGRYHILDWKTNQLSDDSPLGLCAAMAEHHYYLQYHLYTLALDRFLAHRLTDYDPAIHLGHVYYVFLRAIKSGTPASGVFSDRITMPRLEALRQTFAPAPTSPTSQHQD
ncbi:UvrD-helicase domain-containing protein [Verrucomicrobiaceae bacterium N1E253]|uniref:DNA 3'-5' helicase n=1 Tax=Oceaniferula marina TaxID=2748318 RepID=A0A851GHH5_9BACT|nr:UvrD-helicase domain-containing protein [Oceaniferula marina]NWK54577.1 UvrD-helicase domain-containing protein [Oceaniferula marina]